MHKITQLFYLPLLATAVLLGASLDAHASNLVNNGSFEQNGGVGEMNGTITSATGWTVGATTDGSPNPFSFIADSTADSAGFPSAFSPPNIMIWGPNTPIGLSSPYTSSPSQHTIGPVANGFTASPDGGNFFGSDAAYATAPLTQFIQGLAVGDQYTLSFYYAGVQFTDALGANTEGWKVSFGSSTVTTPILNNASEGFTGWKRFANIFTATSTNQTLIFLAQGGPSGLPPFALLDGVSLTDTTDVPPSAPPTTPEPGTVVLLISGMTGAIGLAKVRTNRA